MTLLEVMVAIAIVATTAVPLLISLSDSHRRVADGAVKRKMKQLMEYKLAHVLLDRPAEGQEPIYVDGAENNFGEEFEAADSADISYSVKQDESLYYYSYRIDSEEIDLGTTGGITGNEEEDEADSREDPGGSPLGGLGGDAAGEEESLGQLRYLVTLTVFYEPGNQRFARNMSIVTYVKHPFESEAMSGPDLGPGGGNIGSGEAGVGSSGDTTGASNAISGGNADMKAFESGDK
ncbi:MAG: type II secretion system protein [Planctomycetes bacterium]|nr:type II secretion system protein [Planctomycetota bacterium]